MFSKRVIEPEMLDHLPPEEARPNLADLVRINQRFGGHSVIRKTLARVEPKDEKFTVLDVGAASGDTARFIQSLYPAASVTSLDQNAVNLEAAPLPKVLADAFALPFAHESFDYVMSSLFLHHFGNEQVTEFLRASYAIARKALLVCDLERSIFPFLFLATTKRILRWNDITVHDGLISVRAAFRAPELLDLSREAGIPNAEIKTYRPAFRLSLVAFKT